MLPLLLASVFFEFVFWDRRLYLRVAGMQNQSDRHHDRADSDRKPNEHILPPLLKAPPITWPKLNQRLRQGERRMSTPARG